MTTLIAVYGSDGCEGRCDASCYNATGPACQCICGGMNHGAGETQARENTTEHVAEWLEEYAKTHDFNETVVPILYECSTRTAQTIARLLSARFGADFVGNIRRIRVGEHKEWEVDPRPGRGSSLHFRDLKAVRAYCK